MIKKSDYVKELSTEIKKKLPEYLQSIGRDITKSNTFQCVAPERHAHSDKNFSCSASQKPDGVWVWTCHGCKEGGTIYEMVNMVEGLPVSGSGFISTTVELCERFGISVDYDSLGMGRKEVMASFNLAELYREIDRYLVANGDYKEALSGDRFGRHYTDAQIDKIISWVPMGCVDPRVLEDHLVEKFGSDTVRQLPFYILEEGKTQGLDRMVFGKDILTISVRAYYGRTTGYVGRAANTSIAKAQEEGKKLPKYKFTSGIGGRRAESMFLLDVCKKEIKTSKKARIVEGPFDAISARLAGIECVVGAHGAAFNEDQADILSQLGVQEIAFIFDPDQAGTFGLVKALKVLMDYDIITTCVPLPVGKDPDKIVSDGLGHLLLEEQDAIEYVLDTTDAFNAKDKNQDVLYQNMLQFVVATCNSSARIRKYALKVAAKTSFQQADVLDDLNKFREKKETRSVEAISIWNDVKKAEGMSLAERAMTLRKAGEAYSRLIAGSSDTIMRDTWDMYMGLIKGERKLPVPIPTGFHFLDQATQFECGTIAVIGGRPSNGKCHGKGTEIVMADGSLKSVENIVVGDLLLGPDSIPRRVLGVTSGYGPMYRVDQKRGEPYTVNEHHLLSIKRSKWRRKISPPEGYKDEVVNVSVSEYLRWPSSRKSSFKGYRSESVEFVGTTPTLPIEPYFIGMWLGDGNSSSQNITSMDREIRQYIEEYATRLGMRVGMWLNTSGCPTFRIAVARGEQNYLLNALRSLALIGKKHIPSQYLTASKSDRFSLLAGLIDTDGCKNTYSYEIIQKSEELARNIVFLARSLGFYCSIIKSRKTIKSTGFEGWYWRINISGNVWEIPVRIGRKKFEKKLFRRRPSVTQISISPIGEGDYYGFEIDGDGLYLLRDFTVTHNSSMMRFLALQMIKSNPDLYVLYISADDQADTAMVTFLSIMTRMKRIEVKKRVDNRTFYDSPEARSVQDDIKRIFTENMCLKGANECPNLISIRKTLDVVRSLVGSRPILVVIDALNNLADMTKDDTRVAIENSIRDLKFFAVETNSCICIISHLTKADERNMGRRPNLGSLKGSSYIEFEAKNVLLAHIDLHYFPDTDVIWRGKDGIPYPIIEINVAKDKENKANEIIPFNFDPESCMVEEPEESKVRSLRLKIYGSDITKPAGVGSDGEFM